MLGPIYTTMFFYICDITVLCADDNIMKMIYVNMEMPKCCKTRARTVGRGAFGLLFISVLVTSLPTGQHKCVSSGSDAGIGIATVAEEALQCTKW